MTLGTWVTNEYFGLASATALLDTAPCQDIRE